MYCESHEALDHYHTGKDVRKTHYKGLFFTYTYMAIERGGWSHNRAPRVNSGADRVMRMDARSRVSGGQPTEYNGRALCNPAELDILFHGVAYPGSFLFFVDALAAPELTHQQFVGIQTLKGIVTFPETRLQSTDSKGAVRSSAEMRVERERLKQLEKDKYEPSLLLWIADNGISGPGRVESFGKSTTLGARATAHETERKNLKDSQRGSLRRPRQ